MADHKEAGREAEKITDKVFDEKDSINTMVLQLLLTKALQRAKKRGRDDFYDSLKENLPGKCFTKLVNGAFVEFPFWKTIEAIRKEAHDS